MQYQIIQPKALLSPFVKHYWILKTYSDSDSFTRTVPTGMMSLIFHRGNRLVSVKDNKLHPRTFISGQYKSFSDIQHSGFINMISVVFNPIGVRAFFTIPANTLAGQRVSPQEMEDKELSQLEVQLTETENDSQCIHLIENFLTKRITNIKEHNLRRIDSSIRLINSGRNEITHLAKAACLSNKQFNRIFNEYVGSSPKEYSRIIRFQRALFILSCNPQIPLTRLAYEIGYFDHSHMIKEFRTFSGYSPSQYLAACPPHSDYFDR